jgi:hypothetical protein
MRENKWHEPLFGQQRVPATPPSTRIRRDLPGANPGRGAPQHEPQMQPIILKERREKAERK